MAEASDIDAVDRPPEGADAPPLDLPPDPPHGGVPSGNEPPVQDPQVEVPPGDAQSIEVPAVEVPVVEVPAIEVPAAAVPVAGEQRPVTGDPSEPPGNHVIAALVVGVWLTVVAISSVAFGASMFNQLDKFPTDANTVDLDAWVFWGLRITVADASRQLHVVALAAAAGALGGLIFTSRALASHFADRDFHARWLPWYFVRVVVAGVLGAVVVMAIAAGLITGGTGSSNVEPSGVVAIAFVTGLASKKALAKFKDLVDVIFASAGSNVTNQADQIARIRDMAARGEITSADADSLVVKVGE